MEATERKEDPNVRKLVDAVNATKDPQKTFEILKAVLMAIAPYQKETKQQTEE